MTSDRVKTPGKAPDVPIVCFSHLGWDEKLFQRPQHLMSELAKLGHPVYYFACVGHKQHTRQPHSGPVSDAPGVNVFTLPYAPQAVKLGKVRRWMAALKVARILATNHVKNPILWFYHPSVFSLGYSHSDSAIVYDIMDHFPSFEKSGDDLYFDELGLLAECDLVFAGGYSLGHHAAQMVEQLANDLKAPDSPNPKVTPSHKDSSKALPPVITLPSGVDSRHFSNGSVSAKQSQNAIPVFGYFGAIDERIDWSLLNALARRTTGTVILAGPVLTDPPAELLENLKCIGPVKYDALPDLLATFDVALIPFRLSALTQYISPTKTPEYLAGGKPVVSTAIPDVIATYGDIVSIARDEATFVSSCLHLAENPPAPLELIAQAKARSQSWADIAREMENHLTSTLSRKAIK